MIIYYQTDERWANKLYSASAPHTETIKSSGCGITCAAMVISNLTKEKVTPDIMADYSVRRGYRIDGVGTAHSLYPAIAKEYNLNCTQCYDIHTATKCVLNGGMVVCSTNGGINGLFSTGGHLFVMCAVEGDICIFADPYLYDGKYNKSFRKNKAKVKNGLVYVKSEFAKTEIITYFCFTGKEKTMIETANDITWELAEKYIEIKDREGFVKALDKAKQEESPLYWGFYKLVNKISEGKDGKELSV